MGEALPNTPGQINVEARQKRGKNGAATGQIEAEMRQIVAIYNSERQPRKPARRAGSAFKHR
jgi:hypothetical protein